MELQSNTKKPLYTREGKFAIICWNEREEPISTINLEDQSSNIYRYSYVKIKFPFTYEQLVSCIIRSNYSDDQMQAIINNYLSDSENEKYLKEFNDMQQWRTDAKNIARTVIDLE